MRAPEKRLADVRNIAWTCISPGIIHLIQQLPPFMWPIIVVAGVTTLLSCTPMAVSIKAGGMTGAAALKKVGGYIPVV